MMKSRDIQINKNTLRIPTGRRQTSWLFTSSREVEWDDMFTNTEEMD